MSRLTGSDALGLFEAYQAIYNPQELTEEQVWEEVENWVNSLVEEGYDLSDYTWEEMYEAYIEEQGAVNWDTGRTASGMSPRSKAATRQAQLSSSPNPQDRTRAAQIGAIRGNMRAAIQATGTSSMNKLQSAGPVASQRFKNAAIRQRGGATASVPVRTVPGLKPANQAAQARRGGGGSSAQGLGSASGTTGRFQVGGGQGYGISGIKLANSYEYDLFDYILEHLVFEGYADTNESALAIMSNMSEEWRQSIVEMSDFEAGGGNAKIKKTGMSKAAVEALGRKNSAKKISTSTSGSKQVDPNTEIRYNGISRRLKEPRPNISPEDEAIAMGKSPAEITKRRLDLEANPRTRSVSSTASASERQKMWNDADPSSAQDWYGPQDPKKLYALQKHRYDKALAQRNNDSNYNPSTAPSEPKLTPVRKTAQQAWRDLG